MDDWRKDYSDDDLEGFDAFAEILTQLLNGEKNPAEFEIKFDNDCLYCWPTDDDADEDKFVSFDYSPDCFFYMWLQSKGLNVGSV
ncbi:MAG: hypothetical protein UT24_C0015G0044 [Candidatus Woesebacteria bacterium GW2011_GWB1_39_12]|uniref:Uncharacterized protein n=1 Tax=Candidatus Woesebacteria bacterium GW2011_GWB1_39_12 TaxID=1618574 RepID=A0A0G0MIP8_9BACT|nr:MAG: hypothetical protein UT24_C0015G0044 [Candidatus Woesebacteria bacterium GW2011_GWB1_39_12]